MPRYKILGSPKFSPEQPLLDLNLSRIGRGSPLDYRATAEEARGCGVKCLHDQGSQVSPTRDYLQLM